MQGEIAAADPTRLFGTGEYDVYNPNVLVTTKGLRVFDQMRRDDQIKAALSFKKHAVLATGWNVRPAEGTDPEGEPVVFARDMLLGLPGTLDKCLIEIMSALDFGFSVTEKLFEDRDGRVWLTALKTRSPHSFIFQQDAFGNLTGLRQQGTTFNDVFPVEKFVVYQYQKEFGNPYGTSDLDAVYRAWWTKDNAYRWLGMMLERYGIPPIFLFYNKKRYLGSQVDNMKSILENLQAATSAVLPRQDKDDLQPWSPELATQVSTTFIPALEMMNQDIARGILMPGMLGVTPDKLGSFARARVVFDVFMFVVEFLRRDIANTMNDQIIKPVHELNFATDDAPVFVFEPLTDQQQIELLNTWQKMVSGKIVIPTEEDEAHIREALEFPERTENSELLPSPETNPPPFGDEGKGEELGSDDDDDEEVGTTELRQTESLFVRRPLVNSEELVAWAKAEGFPTTIPLEDMHVTVLYSKEGFDDPGRRGEPDEVRVSGGTRKITRLGPNGAVVLEFESDELRQRHEDLLASGAVSDFDDYLAHVTITWRGQELTFDPEEIEPFDGDLVFGPERRSKIKKEFDPDAMRAKELASDREARPFSEATARCDFRQMERELDGVEGAATEAMQGVFAKAQEDLIKRIGRRGVPTADEISTMSFPRVPTLRQVTKTMLRDSFDSGRKTLNDDVNAAIKANAAGDPVTFKPTRAIEHLNDKAVVVAGITSEKALTDVKSVLSLSLANGETTGEAQERVRKALKPYVGEGDASPHRLETIVRTNTTDAFNKGRLTEMRQPGFDGLIDFVEYSAILDTRTTEVCTFLDGKIFRKSDPQLDSLTPPNHFNCRSVLVPITPDIDVPAGDVVDKKTASKAQGLAGDGFTTIVKEPLPKPKPKPPPKIEFEPVKRMPIRNSAEAQWEDAWKGANTTEDVTLAARGIQPIERILDDEIRGAYYSPVNHSINMGGFNTSRLDHRTYYRHEYGHAIDSRIMRKRGLRGNESARDVGWLKDSFKDWETKLKTTPTTVPKDILKTVKQKHGVDFEDVFKVTSKGPRGKEIQKEALMNMARAFDDGDMISFQKAYQSFSGIGESALDTGEHLMLADLVEATTRTKYGHGHGRDYYKQFPKIASRYTGGHTVEAFANFFSLYTSPRKEWRVILDRVAPKITARGREILNTARTI